MWEKIKAFFSSFSEMIKSTSNETIVRTIVLFIMIINAACSLMGWTPIDIDENAIYQVVSAIGVVISAIWAWWKNNSFTKAAQEADEVLATAKHAKTE